MTTRRWIGYVGMIDRATEDDRVLTLDNPADLARFVKWQMPRFPDDDRLDRLRCAPLPLPLLSTAGRPIGHIDTVGLTRTNRVAAAGAITVEPDTDWGTALLDGGSRPVALTFDQGDTTDLVIRRRPVSRLWRAVTRTYRVTAGWRITGAALAGEHAPWRTQTYLRLSAGTEG